MATTIPSKKIMTHVTFSELYKRSLLIHILLRDL